MDAESLDIWGLLHVYLVSRSVRLLERLTEVFALVVYTKMCFVCGLATIQHTHALS